MKFLVSYVRCSRNMEKADASNKICVEYAEFDDFKEAVLKYTLECDLSQQVVLADVEKQTIIRQFTRDYDDYVGIG